MKQSYVKRGIFRLLLTAWPWRASWENDKLILRILWKRLKQYLVCAKACFFTLRIEKANLLKGKDAKPWIYGHWSMIARLPIFVMFHNSTPARSWLVYFFAEAKIKEVGLCQRKAFYFFWDLSRRCWLDVERQAVLFLTPCRRGAALKNRLSIWTWVPFGFVRLL